jgi:pseudouridine synthase
LRLQKLLADAGVASRRAGEKIILAGRVEVNGQPARVLGTRVDPLQDRVTVDGRAIKARRKLYLALNKPRGYVCSRNDPQRRQSLGDLLPKEWGHLYSVGRLDLDSEGLVFLTNDGEFCLRLTHPRYGVRKRYRVAIQGRVEPEMLVRMVRGVRHQDQLLRAREAHLVERNNTQSIVELELAEGKNREVRRLFEAQGLVVSRLQRTQIGRIKLGELPLGKWRALTESEIQSLLADV